MRLIILLTGLILTGCATTQNFVEQAAITNSRLTFPVMSSQNPTSERVVDHSAFDRFLNTYLVQDPVSGVNLIKYAEVTSRDQNSLTQYVNRLQHIRVADLNRGEQLAFWLNLYNADTIRAVLEDYPVKSIRNIKSHPLDFKGPWNDIRLTVQGEALTLDDIENRIVRPVFKDPRIHYALNCAAIGCPNLRNKAYTRENLGEALDAQARAFINNPRGIRVEDGTVTASRIFLWYKDDYGQSEQDILEHVRAYASPELLRALEGVTSIDTYAYDWDLNTAEALTSK